MAKRDDLMVKVLMIKKDTSREMQLSTWAEVIKYCKNYLQGNTSEFSEAAHWENWFGTQAEVEAELERIDQEGEPEPDKDQQRAEALLREANSYLDGTFRLAYNEEGQSIDIFKVTDEKNKVVTKVNGASDDALRWAIRANTGNKVIPVNRVKAMIDQWRHNGDQIPYPKIHGWLETDEWVTYRCTIEPREGLMPAWESWLNRLNDPKAYAAAIYGTLSGQYKGRQILWVEGTGETRKTFVSNLLAEVGWGDTRGTIDGMAVRSSGSNFLAANFVGKALVTWDDCANTRALLTEGVKQLTMGESGNKVSIEFKGKQAYSARLSTRLWINSNRSPELTGDNAARSRLLYVHVSEPTDPPKDGMTQQYRDELPAFLHYAKQCYREVCPDNYKIIQTPEALETIESFEDNFYSEVIDDVFSAFYLDEDTEVTLKEFKDTMEDQNQKYKKPDKLKLVRDYLEKRLGITVRKTNSKV